MSGVYDTTITANIDQSGYFFVADVLLDGQRKWFDCSWQMPDTVKAVVTNLHTGYDFDGNTIKINNIDNYKFLYPDQFDVYAILHEYGHFLEDSYGFLKEYDTM